MMTYRIKKRSEKFKEDEGVARFFSGVPVDLHHNRRETPGPSSRALGVPRVDEE